MKIVCFLPCRKGSQRVENKNIRPFGGFEHGLIEIKLKQLQCVKEIDHILLSTNDQDIIKFAKSLNIEKLIIHHRSDELSSSETSTDEVIEMVSNLIDDGHILWTHVTSPFINHEIYEDLIKVYQDSLEKGYDSLMTTTVIQSFLWSQDGPLNYDRNLEKWPRTQTLTELYEINSGAFLTSAKIYKEKKDRVGHKVKLYQIDKITGHDIDWPEDFVIAESFLNAGLGKINP